MAPRLCSLGSHRVGRFVRVDRDGSLEQLADAADHARSPQLGEAFGRDAAPGPHDDQVTATDPAAGFIHIDADGVAPEQDAARRGSSHEAGSQLDVKAIGVLAARRERGAVGHGLGKDEHVRIGRALQVLRRPCGIGQQSHGVASDAEHVRAFEVRSQILQGTGPRQPDVAAVDEEDVVSIACPRQADALPGPSARGIVVVSAQDPDIPGLLQLPDRLDRASSGSTMTMIVATPMARSCRIVRGNSSTLPPTLRTAANFTSDHRGSRSAPPASGGG